jgi:DNA-binding NtrC family response regulator
LYPYKNLVLLDRIASNDFREDLYYRLIVIHLVIPPLRARIEDIEPLLHHFLNAFSDKYGASPPELDPDVLPALLQHPWPGNVRELKNVAERLIVLAKKGPIRVDDLPPLIASGGVASQPVRPTPRVASLNGVAEPPARSVGELFDRIVTRRESFWNAVYTPFMSRDLTRDDVRALVKAGLQHTRGNYKVLLELFNMDPADYKRFLNFLRKHQCHMRFQQFRTSEPIRPVVEPSTRASGF